jgi:hypothetical protein
MASYNTDTLFAAAVLTDTSFPSVVPTTTEPTGDGTQSPPDERAQYDVLLRFWGTGDPDTTFDARVWGWNLIGTLWVPDLVLACSCTLSATVGVAAATIANTGRFVDTISASIIPTDAELISPASDLIGSVRLFGLSHKKLQLVADLTGATGANAVIKFLARRSD